MSLDYSRSSQTSYSKHEEEQHKTDENLLNLRVFQGTQLILQVFSVEYLPLWREELQSHQLSLGEPISSSTVELFCPRMAGHWQSTEPDLRCTLTNPSSHGKACQRFYATWKGPVLVFRASCSVTIAHARKL